MRMTSTGAFPSAFAAARPPKPPPTITTRGVFDLCSSAPLIELRLASFIHFFLKLSKSEISENLRDFAPARRCAPAGPQFFGGGAGTKVATSSDAFSYAFGDRVKRRSGKRNLHSSGNLMLQ